MSQLSRQALWERLRDAGLVAGALPDAGTIESPWYVRVMLGTAGWIGSLFLLGFVGVGFSFVMQNEVAALLLGILVCGGAWQLFKSRPDSDFITQFGLAIGLLGQMLVIYGLAELLGLKDSYLYAAVCCVEVILTLVMPNFIYRVLSSAAAAVALTLFLHSFAVYEVATPLIAAGFALLWLQDLKWLRFSELCRPAGYGLALALLCYRGGIVWGGGFGWYRHSGSDNLLALYSPWLGKGLLVAVFLVVTVCLLKRLQLALTGMTGLVLLGSSLLLVVAALPAQGLASALLILLVGFAVCNRVLLGLGLIACGGFLSNYYYMMQSTLLMKSMTLFVLGATLLVGRLILNKLWPAVVRGGPTDA